MARRETGNGFWRVCFCQKQLATSMNILESNQAPGGICEPSVAPIAPAVANAIAAITGVHPCRLPISPERIREMLKRG